jgi:hypothetical protein
MEQINELSSMLNQHFEWNKARMDCFVGMLIGVLKSRSMNLTEIALAFPNGSVKVESRYRRIQHFVHSYPIDFDHIALFIMLLFCFNTTSYYLTLDRTNWQWGKKDINILMLAVVYRGVAIPVYWLLLNKKGNSNTCERVRLLRRFIKQFGKQSILGVLADREFIGGQWLDWLKSEAIPFHIRVKKNAKVPNSRGLLVQAQCLFRFLRRGETLILCSAKTMTGVAVYLSALRLDDGELLIVASSNPCCDAIEIYSKRWQIETLFSCLKGRGFNLEDTRVTDRHRINALLVVPIIAFCWAHRTGEWRHQLLNPIKVKKHSRPANSFFKYGLDWLRDALLNKPLKIVCADFLHFIDFKNICLLT